MRNSRLGRVAVLLGVLSLGGCGAQECALGIAHGDCYERGTALEAFPQDDAVCRSYGLTPDTRDYAVCRKAKHHVRRLTGDETDDSYLRNPLLPDLR